MEKRYIPRLFDGILDFALKSKGAVIVVGPKWCGKSRTCKRHAKSVIDLMPTETRESFVGLAKASPSSFLSYGKPPMLIDEWQHVSFISDDIKAFVDEHGFGQLILTGSVTDKGRTDDKSDASKHTGNGRIVKKIMRPMSLFESGEGNGTVSIKDLKNGIFKPAFCHLNIDDYAFLLCRGGWPLAIGEEKDVALQQAIDYVDMLATDDLFSLHHIKIDKDEQKARRVLRSYARNVSIPASDKTLLDDCFDEKETFDKETFSKYLLALKCLYVVEELPAWNPNLRSKTAIRSKPTRHFVDPSIAAASLGLTPKGLFKDITTFGLLFESMVVRDLRIYCQSIGANLYKYRDSKKREADCVIQFRDGSWALIEVKLGNEEDIEEAAAKLKAIASDIDDERTGNLAFLMVVSKNISAYRRDDGVYVVPLGCLRD